MQSDSEFGEVVDSDPEVEGDGKCCESINLTRGTAGGMLVPSQRAEQPGPNASSADRGLPSAVRKLGRKKSATTVPARFREQGASLRPQVAARDLAGDTTQKLVA